MRKLFIVLFALFVVSFTNQVRAEDSATMYEPLVRSQQVFIAAYNSGADTIAINAPVILDIGNGTDGSTKGAYIMTTTTTDSIFSVGVTDEAIAPGSMGRICVRGPHKVATIIQSYQIATGQIFTTSTTQGKAAPYSTADGTAGGQIGIIISTTASTTTGDAALTYWGVLNPRFHK